MAKKRQHPERPRWRRILAPANIGAVIAGVAVFLTTIRLWDTFAGAFAAAAAASLVTGLIWVLWWRITAPPAPGDTLSVPLLASIPVVAGTPTPTLVAPESAAAEAYRGLAHRIEAETAGQVLLVTSPSPGQGSTTVALNLAIAATLEGRRVALVDGDISRGGLSRFGRSGAGSGLLDLAAGDADLAGASRLWTLAEGTRMPFIPRGTPRPHPEELLTGAPLADAVDDLTEHADLLIIDVAPLTWDPSAKPLAAHADGSLLVVAEGADPTALERAERKLEEAGAPAVGHVVNRAGTRGDRAQHPAARMLKRSLATFLIALSVYGVWNAFQIWNSWRTAERNELAVANAEDLLPLPTGGLTVVDVDEETSRVVTAIPTPSEEFTSFLVVGSDVGGLRADVIILAMLPSNNDPPLMVSLPRDLYLPNRCTQTYTRINANLAGCGADVNGPTLLALAVEDFTGVEVDHFALFDFEGFEDVIDEVGGIEICVDNAVRDQRSQLDLPAGCTIATGAQALSWVRSRHTQELVNGSWRTMPGVNDLTRNARQQDVILQMIAKLRSFDSVGDLTGKVRSLTGFFTFDDQLGISDAISIAWDLRTIDLGSILRYEIPVAGHVTGAGAQVLIPTAPFSEILDAAYPNRRVDPA
jgi:LCP family protein required for cell wall assembly